MPNVCSNFAKLNKDYTYSVSGGKSLPAETKVTIISKFENWADICLPYSIMLSGSETQFLRNVPLEYLTIEER